VTLERFPDRVLALAERFPNHLRGGRGSIPIPSKTGARIRMRRLLDSSLLRHPRVVAIGETGLDYYRLEDDLEWQRERFRIHIRAARRNAGKPLIIHTREAAADTSADTGRRTGRLSRQEAYSIASPKLSTMSPRPPWTLGFHISLLRHCHLQERASNQGGGVASCRSTGSWSRPMPPIWRPSRTAAS
jgi:hypothetical protein